jgi:integrase
MDSSLGAKALRAVTTQEIQQLYGRLGETLSAQSIVHVHRVLREALQSAEDWDLILKNPARRVTLPKVPRPDLYVPTAEEAVRFMQAADSHRLRALWIWLVRNGTRMGEALGARWEDIDWERRTVRIQQALTGVGRQRLLGPVKSRDGFRIVELSDVMVDALRQHRNRQQAERRLAGTQWVETGLIFVTRHGSWLDSRNVHRDFKLMLKRAELPSKIRPHDMRHFMATYWLSQGVSLKVVSGRLGHSDAGFTLRVYGHVLTGQQRMAVDAMDAALNGTTIPTTSPRT